MYLLYIYFMFLFYSTHVCTENNELKTISIHDGPYPMHWDWRERGMVTPVKNQGNCSAGWAFSAVACIESHLKIYLDQEVTLSEQFIIDCDTSNVGCGSTSVFKAFGRLIENFGGVLRSDDYLPYANKQQLCSFKYNNQVVPIVGYRRVRSSENTMVEYIANYGPLSAVINSASMRKYKGGIDDPSDELCPADKIDHAILIVGFNTHVDKKTGKVLSYWIIKNSWGTEWGDDGFYYLVRGRNACGIASDVSFSYVN